MTSQWTRCLSCPASSAITLLCLPGVDSLVSPQRSWLGLPSLSQTVSLIVVVLLCTASSMAQLFVAASVAELLCIVYVRMFTPCSMAAATACCTLKALFTLEKLERV